MNANHTTNNMETRKYFKLMIFTITAIILLIQTSTVSACSCMPQHPQTTFCKSDYGMFTVCYAKTLHCAKKLSSTYLIHFLPKLCSNYIYVEYLHRNEDKNINIVKFIWFETARIARSWWNQFSLYSSDFVFRFLFMSSVIIARILRKSVRRIEQNDVYKIEIKKAYKVCYTINDWTDRLTRE